MTLKKTPPGTTLNRGLPAVVFMFSQTWWFPKKPEIIEFIKTTFCEILCQHDFEILGFRDLRK